MWILAAALTGCAADHEGRDVLDDEDARWDWDDDLGADLPAPAPPEPQSSLLAAVDRPALRLRDVDGAPLEGFAWTVDAPDLVEIDADGFVTALGPIGDTIVYGDKNGVTVGPILVTTVDLVDDVWTYEDIDVDGADPSFMGEDEHAEAVWRVLLTNPDLTPQVGDTLVATGDVGVSGEVVEVTPNIWNAAQRYVTVRPTDLTALFEELDIDVGLDALPEAATIDGSPTSQIFFWECEDSLAQWDDLPLEISGGAPQLSVKGENPGGKLLRFSARISGGHASLVARMKGQLELTHHLEVDVAAEGDFDITCNYEMLHVPLPTHPAIRFLVAELWVTGGIGVSAGVQATAQAVEFDFDTTGTLDVDLGFAWTQHGGYQVFDELHPALSIVPQLDIDLGTAVSVTPSLFPHVYLTLHGQAGGNVGRKVASAWRWLFGSAPPALEEFELLTARAGLAAQGTFWHPVEQLLPFEPPQQSTYGLYKKFVLGTDAKFRRLVGKLGLDDQVPLELTLEDPLWESPQGLAFVDPPDCVAPGDSVAVTVVLDPDTVDLPLVGIPNLQTIELRHHQYGEIWHHAVVDEVDFVPGQYEYTLYFVPEPGEGVWRESIAVFANSVAAPNVPTSIGTQTVKEITIHETCE